MRSTQPERCLELDCLRAVAVLLVIGRHWIPPICGVPTPLAFFFETWRRGGWVGVDLFFVLSGFLVSGLLFRELQTTGSLRPGRFLVRRALKIYPAFYLFLFLTLPLNDRYRSFAVSGQSFVGEVFFLQNYLAGMWNHTWSLAVEEHFYLLIPFVLVLLARNPAKLLRRVLTLSAIVAATCLALRFHWLAITDQRDHTIPTATHLRIDSLMFGVALAALFHRAPLPLRIFATRFRSHLLVVGAAALALPFCFELTTTYWLKTIGPTLLYLASGCWVLLAATQHLPTTRLTRGLATVGANSYSIYLWHMPIAWAFAFVGARWLGHDPSAVWIVPYTIASILIGLLMAKLIERPVLRLRDRIFPANSADRRTSPEQTRFAA